MQETKKKFVNENELCFSRILNLVNLHILMAGEAYSSFSLFYFSILNRTGGKL